MTAKEDVRRFMLLYRANTRSFGNWDPKSRNTHTEKREIGYDDFVEHFAGKMGVGCVPLRDDNTCYWGAIDIDNHGQTEDTDICSVEKAVQDAGLPLVATRSKSGGVHLYLYLSEPVKAALVRRVLKEWADRLSVPGTDCLFPKHDQMNRDNDTGELGLSNWINFPYFNSGGKTDRYAVVNGKPADLGLFLDYAEGKRQSNSDMQKWANADHSEAPPCLQSKFNTGFAPGERNTGIYQITIYARKRNGADTDTANNTANELSEKFMPDIKYGERQKTIKSALSKTYNYKCDDFQDVCDREACRKRKFGVSESQYRDMRAKESIPKFVEATMWVGLDEPRWSVKAEVTEGVEYDIKYMTTDEFRKYDLFRRKMIEISPIFLPSLKQGEWEAIIGPVMANRITMPIPEDITDVGVIRSKLQEFLGRANWQVDRNDIRNRAPLVRGLPVVQSHKGEDVVMFRSQDFEKYLRDTRTSEKKNLWMKVRDSLGARPEPRIRVGPNFVTIWVVPAKDYEPSAQEPHDFTPEY